LARLLNNKDEICIALSYVKDKLLIAGNDEKIKSQLESLGGKPKLNSRDKETKKVLEEQLKKLEERKEE